jgi:hypothetical protein
MTVFRRRKTRGDEQRGWLPKAVPGNTRQLGLFADRDATKPAARTNQEKKHGSDNDDDAGNAGT